MAGTYTVIATNICGTDTASFVVNSVCQYSDTSQTICQGDSVFFSNIWLTQAGTYHDTTLIGSVNIITTLHLTVNYVTQAILIYAPDTICNSSIYVLPANLLDTTLSTSTIHWKINGNIVGTGYTYYPTAIGTYTISIISSCGNTDTSYTVNTLCTTSSVRDSICTGDSLLFANNWLTQGGTYTDTILNGSVYTITTLTLTELHTPDLEIYPYIDPNCNAYLIAYDTSAGVAITQIVWIYNQSVAGYGPVLSLSTAGTYTAVAQGVCGNDTTSYVAVPCSIDTSDVWPGDANSDGIADNYDLLSVGIGYGVNGATRSNPTLLWQAQTCTNWSTVYLNGTNIKHADSDGNGVVNANDTLAIIQNFGLTHSKKEDEPAEQRSGIPTLYVVLQKDTFYSGDIFEASIRLGDANMPVSGIYGLAFTYNFDPTLFDASSIGLSYTNSWLGDNSDRISIAKEFIGDGKIKTAITRIDQNNRSGYGEIARFRAVVAGGNDAVVTATNFITGLKAIGNHEDSVAVNEGIDSAKIVLRITGISEAENEINWPLYPNPATHTIYLNKPLGVMDFTVTDVVGKVVQSEKQYSSNQISVAHLANGIYYFIINQKQVQRFSVIHND